MRDRAKTIQALRRMAERPGTTEEGETAKQLLEKFGSQVWIPRPFEHSQYPRGTRIYYCYWCYRNEAGMIASDKIRHDRGEVWMRIKFDSLRQPRWVPVTSPLGCHLGFAPFSGNNEETLYRMDEDWKLVDEEFIAKMRKLGFDIAQPHDFHSALLLRPDCADNEVSQ